MISLTRKTALITGAAGGIGEQVARLMADAGANVALSDIEPDGLNALRADLAAHGAQASCHTTDVSNAASCRQTAGDIAKRYGHIDYLVHAAGVYPECLVKDMDEGDWRRLMSVNLDGTFFMCNAVIPFLSEQSAIVTLSSIAGHRGSYAHAHYAASKGAVSSFCKSLALELAPKTRVNTVAPGIIATSMTEALLKQKGQALLCSTPLQRFGSAREVAGAILFLCSDLASFITGETLHVNGGLLMA